MVIDTDLESLKKNLTNKAAQFHVQTNSSYVLMLFYYKETKNVGDWILEIPELDLTTTVTPKMILNQLRKNKNTKPLNDEAIYVMMII